ncbi:nucleoside hydrolase [Hoeflea ulvae]|uniref:Nucleoside hydrolase n=1 Tax=Hoeflea ulvae TaxID=2983764 RepID=A0ABT3YM59_9HYPH|nr:nucleoside hydrolase [Hoeflea ulvae]MCY0096985.1 nucleoside hydrolase [Hoeflea ulvae]
MTTPILMDCDPGHDDAIALVMAHRSPAIDLRAVTTVCGNATIERTTANTLRILNLIGCDAPVYQGCANPLVRDLVLGTADGPSGLDGSPYLPEPGTLQTDIHAVDFLAQTLMSAPEPMVIVATGPLTNLGMLFLKHPETIPKIARIISMGGAFWRRDETITPTEFNIFCDPEAAQIVFDSGVDVLMVGLDVTMKVLVEAPQFETLAKIDTDLGRVVHDWLRYYEKLHRGQMGIGGAMHDPLALALVIDPTLVRSRPAHVAVDLTGTYMFGATVADFWNERGIPANVQVASEVDADRFFELLWSLIRD